MAGDIVEAQIRIIADSMEGLLPELGKVIASCGFRLVKHYMVVGSKTVSFTLSVRGPEANLLELADRFASSVRVRSYESRLIEPPEEQVAPLVRAAPAVPITATAPAQAPASSLQAAEVTGPIKAAKAPFDAERLEQLLPQLAADYPHILPKLALLQRELNEGEQEQAMLQIGARVGSWVYRRDFARGAKLTVGQAIRQVALPAIRRLVPAELEGDEIRIRTSPFCDSRPHGKTCHFFRGFFRGVVSGATAIAGEEIRVEEALCASLGSKDCRFVIAI